jgi:hypothetical protein
MTNTTKETTRPSMKTTPNSAKAFVSLVAVLALVSLGYGLLRWESADLARFACFVLVSAAASRMKLTLPGLNGNMSMNVPFMLLAALELSLAETLVVAFVSIVVQCLPKNGKRMTALQVVFNIALIVNAIGAAHLVVQRASLLGTLPAKSLVLAASALAFFVCNTVPVAIVLGLAEKANVAKTWKDICLLTFPYFVLSAGLASMAATAVHFVGWQIPLAIFPVMVLTYASYKRYFAQPAELAPLLGPLHSSAAAD